MSTPESSLLEGVAVLDSVLGPYGFVFRAGSKGASSGGPFASGRFERGERAIELHVRGSLGLVTYHIGNATLSHEAYLRLGGNWSNRRYPNFGGNPIDSFHALAHDLSSFCTDFLHGDGTQFQAFAAEMSINPDKLKGFTALSK